MMAGAPEDLVKMGELRRQITSLYPPDHPLTIASRDLPETLPRADYLALLRALLPLARIREDR